MHKERKMVSYVLTCVNAVWYVDEDRMIGAD